MKLFTFLSALVIFGNASAQRLIDYIPANTSMVFSLAPAQLKEKSGQQDYSLFLMPLLKQRNDYYYGGDILKCDLLSLKNLVTDPARYGVDIRSNIYVYQTSSELLSGTAYLFSLADANLFAAGINTDCSDTGYILQRTTADGSIFVSGNTSVRIKGNVGIVFVKDFSYTDSYYTNDSYYGNGYDATAPAYETAPVEQWSPDTVMMEDYSDEVPAMEEGVPEGEIGTTVVPPLSAIQAPYDDAPAIVEESQGPWEEENKRWKAEARRAQNSVMYEFILEKVAVQKENISSNKDFWKLDQEKHDAYVYVNTLSLINSAFSGMSYLRYMVPREMNAITNGNELLQGSAASYAIDFTNGKATVKVTTNYSEKAYPYIKKIYDVKQSDKLFKYIDAENLVGYASMAVSTREMATFYEAIYKETVQHFPVDRKSAYVFPAMELVYAFLDKEVLYNTFTGQAMIACTGFEDVPVKYTTYDYDDNFNRVEKTEESVQKQPKMVMLSAVGNYENARKLFDIISRFDVFTKVNDNVFVFMGKRNMPANIYVALTKDVLIITNDPLLVNNLDGVKKPKQLSKTDKKQIMDHNVAMKINTTQMLTSVNNAYFSKQHWPYYETLLNNLGEVEIYSDKPQQNGSTATAVLNLKNASANSLYVLLEMMSSMNAH